MSKLGSDYRSSTFETQPKFHVGMSLMDVLCSESPNILSGRSTPAFLNFKMTNGKENSEPAKKSPATDKSAPDHKSAEKKHTLSEINRNQMKVKLPQIGKLSSVSTLSRSRLNSIQFSSASVLQQRLHNRKSDLASSNARRNNLNLIDLTDVLEVFDLVKSPDSQSNDKS